MGLTEWLAHLLNPLRGYCDEWCLHVWEAAGTWFAGLATFGAVLVSLMLARRDLIRLRVSAGHRIAVQPGDAEPFPEFLSIAVRNVGSRPAVVEGIGWRRRPWRKLHGYQLWYPTAGYPGPPAKVDPGGACYFKLPLDDPQVKWGEWFLKDFVGRWPRIGAYFIRVLAWTPAGDQFSAFLEPSLRKWLVEKAASMKAGRLN
jgi:hypothetical protein